MACSAPYGQIRQGIQCGRMQLMLHAWPLLYDQSLPLAHHSQPKPGKIHKLAKHRTCKATVWITDNQSNMTHNQAVLCVTCPCSLCHLANPCHQADHSYACRSLHAVTNRTAQHTLPQCSTPDQLCCSITGLRQLVKSKHKMPGRLRADATIVVHADTKTRHAW